MELAQERQVVQVGRAAGFPRDDVVHVDEGRRCTPREATWRSRRITSRRWASVGKRRARPSYMVWPTSSSTATDHRGVTGQALASSRASTSPSWARARPPAQLLSPDSSTRADRATWATTKVGAGLRWPGPTQHPGPRADQPQEGVAAALVPAASPPSEGSALARADQAPLVCGIGLGGNWSDRCGGHRCSASSAGRARRVPQSQSRAEPEPEPRPIWAALIRATSTSWRTEAWATSHSS